MDNSLRPLQRAATAALLAGALAAVGAKEPLERGLRFDSAGVLDLAEHTRHRGDVAVAVTTLSAADAARIRGTPALTEDPPVLKFSDDVFGCAKPSKACSEAHERTLIAASGGSAKREGKRLTVGANGAPAAVFVDWTMPETKTADGDEETHWYLGTLPSSGYARVEVQFSHDAPGNFLINAANGKVAFVHNGADIVAPSPDGLRLLTFNTLNPPLSIRVASLDRSGPRTELECAVSDNNEKARAEFKGWHDATSFDLLIQPDGVDGKTSIPARVSLAGAGSVAVPDSRLPAGGFACWP